MFVRRRGNVPQTVICCRRKLIDACLTHDLNCLCLVWTIWTIRLLAWTNMVELVRFHWLPLSCSNKIARMKPLCVCYWLRCPSSELLGRRTGACRTARQWVNESMSSGARALTQCGKKRMQMHREPTPIWMSMTPVCFWNLWLVDIFEKLDDGWPESVEEQGLLLLVWRHHIRNNILKMCYRQSRRGVLRQNSRSARQ